MGPRHSKNQNEMYETISSDIVKELCRETGFTEEEIREYHTNFYKDCPDGKLTLKQFEHAYSKIMGKPTHKTSAYIRQMFNVYDEDHNQFIDFREFIMTISAASVVNRLRLVETLFRVFDLDHDGRITKAEIGQMLNRLTHVIEPNRKRFHRHPRTKAELEKRVDNAFNELNANDDDHITKNEFIEWYFKSGLLSDLQGNEMLIPDTASVQKLEKINRKAQQQETSEKNQSNSTRTKIYMSKMNEIKSHQAVIAADGEDYQENNPQVVNVLSQRKSDGSEESDSQSSRENDRWQHLFNSVLGQIRANRSMEQQISQNSSQQTQFMSWKQAGEETLKAEYFKEKYQDSIDKALSSEPSETLIIRL